MGITLKGAVEFDFEIYNMATDDLQSGDMYISAESSNAFVWDDAGNQFINIGIPGAIQGPVGLTGPTGPPGPIGPIGLTGLRGSTGLTGLRGSTGLTGPVGLRGETGEIGATGEKGRRGYTGSTGIDGPNTITALTTSTLNGILSGQGGIVTSVTYSSQANPESLALRDSNGNCDFYNLYVGNDLVANYLELEPVGPKSPQFVISSPVPTLEGVPPVTVARFGDDDESSFKFRINPNASESVFVIGSTIEMFSDGGLINTRQISVADVATFNGCDFSFAGDSRLNLTNQLAPITIPPSEDYLVRYRSGGSITTNGISFGPGSTFAYTNSTVRNLHLAALGVLPFADKALTSNATANSAVSRDNDSSTQVNKIKVTSGIEQGGNLHSLPLNAGRLLGDTLSGTAVVAAGSQQVQINQGGLTTNAVVMCQVVSDDATAKTAIVLRAAGNFIIKCNAAATAACNVSWLIVKL